LALPDFDPERKLGLFGVFDGHGGAAVAKVAARKLPETLRSLSAFKEGRYDEALQEAFLKLDAFLDSPDGRKEVKKLMEECPDATDPEEDEEEEAAMIQKMIANGELNINDLAEDGEEEDPKKAGGEDDEEEDSDFDMEDEEEEDEEEEEEEEGDLNSAWANGEGPDGMGCTAVVALVLGGENPEVICANAGDSRCVLARGTQAVNMSRDHKPTLKCERLRIKKAGGFVTAEGRVDGNLNLSRALGDFAYKKDKKLKPTEQKISCEAEVRRRDLGDGDRYILIGCDGIFEKASSQALVEFMLPQLKRRSARQGVVPLSGACSAFLDHNIAKVPAKEEGLGCDNMTLMVIDLHAKSDAEAAPRVKATGAGLRPTKRAKGRSALKPFGGRQGVRQSIDKGRFRAPHRRRLIMRAHRQNTAKSAETSSAANGKVMTKAKA